VHPHAGRYGFAPRQDAEQRLRLEMLTEFERRQHPPPRMILLRHRGAKQRRKAVAGDVHHGAFIALYHLLGAGSHRLHHLMHGLWSLAHRQGWGITHGTAEHRDVLVLRRGG
jgi:hypothetical protein